MASTNVSTSQTRDHATIINIDTITANTYYPLENTTIWGSVADTTINPFPSNLQDNSKALPYTYLKVNNQSPSRVAIKLDGSPEKVLVVDKEGVEEFNFKDHKIIFKHFSLTTLDADANASEITIECRRINFRNVPKEVVGGI